MKNDENGTQIKMNNILITGFSGFLGRHLIDRLSHNKNYTLYGFTRKKTGNEDNLTKVFDYLDWEQGSIPWSDIDTVIHCSFARESNGQQLAESLDFLSEFMGQAVAGGVKSWINISSQSIYGQALGTHAEVSEVDPDYLYAMAKYASELLVNAIGCKIPHTNLRLAGLAVGKPAKMVGVLPTFVQRTLNEQPITIKNGFSRLSIIDVRDAVEAIEHIIRLDPQKWHEAYNIGNDWQITIVDLAKRILAIGQEQFNRSTELRIDDLEVGVNAYMDIDRIKSQTGWEAKIPLDQIIVSLFEQILESTHE